MKTIFILLTILGACSVQAQTNFDVLECRDACYTNATITRATAAYIVVDFDGGIAKVALTNLPALLQEKYHYDPEQAAAQEEAEQQLMAKRHAALLAQQRARQQYLADMATNCVPIFVDSILDEQFGQPKCEVSSAGGGGGGVNVPAQIILRDMPGPVKDFVTKKQQLAAAIENLKNATITVTSAVNDPNDDDPGFTAQMNNQTALADAREAARNKIAAMKEDLAQMDADSVEKSALKAYYTGQSYGGFQIWESMQ